MNKHEYVPIKLRLGRQVVGQIQPPGWNLLLWGRIVGVLLADSKMRAMGERWLLLP